MAFSKLAGLLSGLVRTGDWNRGDVSTGRHHYDPTQPRVPAGNSDGGQWTAGGWRSERASALDGEVLSDATPDNEWRPGARYASRRRAPPSDPTTPGQAVRLATANARARDSIGEVQKREPNWQPAPFVSNTVEGQIAGLQARAREAEARLQELVRHGIGPGPFACDWIPAPIGRRLNSAERAEINRTGDLWGCHTCGARNPGTASGTWFGDHQHPTAMSFLFRRGQRIYPHCRSCSGRQGGWITQWMLRLKGTQK